MFIRERNGYKYRIYTANNDKTVIAVSSSTGRIVRGVAKCDPTDTPDLEKGIDLAILRCDEKIANKKVKRGIMKVKAAKAELDFANKKYAQALEYLSDSEQKLLNTSKDLIAFEDSMR